MTKLIIFSRRNTTEWWRHIASQLDFIDQAIIISGVNGDGADINIMPTFYYFYNQKIEVGTDINLFTEHEYIDIILRCRLLRNLEHQSAIKMINATWLSLNQILDREQPKIAISFMIDYFVPDLLERALRLRKIPFIAICGSILPDRMMLTARGEYIPCSEPTEEEILIAVEKLSAPNFTPTVSTTAKYTYFRFLQNWLFWRVRQVVLDTTRWIKRDPLNPEYLITPKRGDDYYVSLDDWKVKNYFNLQWQQQLEIISFEQRVFAGLQYNPESTLDYWVEDLRLANYIETLEKIAKVLTSAGFTLFIKDHPNMFGLRNSELFSRLYDYPGVVFVPYEVTSQYLIDNCKSTFTWTGTIGMQAAMSGRCAIVTNPYYAIDKYFIKIRKWEDIDKLPEQINNFQPPQDLSDIKRSIAHRVLSASILGNCNCLKFNITNAQQVAQTVKTIDSLNTYISQLVTK